MLKLFILTRAPSFQFAQSAKCSRVQELPQTEGKIVKIKLSISVINSRDIYGKVGKTKLLACKQLTVLVELHKLCRLFRLKMKKSAIDRHISEGQSIFEHS